MPGDLNKGILIAVIIIILCFLAWYFMGQSSSECACGCKKNEYFITPAQFSGMTRGYNKMYTNNGYTKPIMKLSEAEKMHLEDVKTEIRHRGMNENFTIAGQMTGGTRGYNALPSGGSYADAMTALSNQEKISLGDVDTNILRKWK